MDILNAGPAATTTESVKTEQRMSAAPSKTTEAITAEVKENKTLLLCFMFDGENPSKYPIFKWYAINPVKKNTKHEEQPPLFSEMPTDTTPDMWDSCVLGSKLYVMGGLYDLYRKKNQRVDRSKKFLVCDISSDGKDWKLWDTPMSGPKIYSQVAVVDGKIYVFGSSAGSGHHIPAAIPWAEVYDPDNDEWSDLPEIRKKLKYNNPAFGEGEEGDEADNVTENDLLIPSGLAVDDKSKKIYICIYRHGTYRSMLENNWAVCLNLDPLAWSDVSLPRELSDRYYLGRFLVMTDENTLVAALDRGLFICDLRDGEPSLKQVQGLEDNTKTLKGRRFLSHLGNQKLRLVWSTDGWIHCLNFHFPPEGQSESWHAIVDGHATYRAPNDMFFACEEVIHTVGREFEVIEEDIEVPAVVKELNIFPGEQEVCYTPTEEDIVLNQPIVGAVEVDDDDSHGIPKISTTTVSQMLHSVEIFWLQQKGDYNHHLKTIQKMKDDVKDIKQAGLA